MRAIPKLSKQRQGLESKEGVLNPRSQQDLPVKTTVGSQSHSGEGQKEQGQKRESAGLLGETSRCLPCGRDTCRRISIPQQFPPRCPLAAITYGRHYQMESRNARHPSCIQRKMPRGQRLLSALVCFECAHCVKKEDCFFFLFTLYGE